MEAAKWLIEECGWDLDDKEVELRIIRRAFRKCPNGKRIAMEEILERNGVTLVTDGAAERTQRNADAREMARLLRAQGLEMPGS